MEQTFSYFYGIHLENLVCGNPFDINDTLRYYNGIPEFFYLIDFLDIDRNSYIITSYGRVFDTVKGRELTPILEKCGHKRIRLMSNGKRKKYFVHRLVALAFIPKTQEDIMLGRDIINHKDNIPGNNIMWNLEWCTTEENTRDYLYRQRFFKPIMTIGRIKKDNPSGDRVYGRTISEEQAHLICQALEKGMNNIECCIYAGIEYNDSTRGIITKIVSGDSWKEISCLYNINRELKQQTKREDFVIPICELLSQGYYSEQIVDMLQMPGRKDLNIRAINKIKNRETYPQISKDYSW